MATKQNAPAPPKPKVRKRNQVPKAPNGGMLLLLVDDVEHVGKAGDVVSVRHGFGRNYLLPRGLATFVSDHNMRRLEKHKIRVQQLREARLADLRALAGQLRDVTVTIESNATEEGKLYGSVGPDEIAKALRGMNYPLDPANVIMEGHIKEVALYAVKVSLGHEIESEVKVLVVGSAQQPQGPQKTKK
jgi:large subunit ribosomal protein L9